MIGHIPLLAKSKRLGGPRPLRGKVDVNFSFFKSNEAFVGLSRFYTLRNKFYSRAHEKMKMTSQNREKQSKLKKHSCLTIWKIDVCGCTGISFAFLFYGLCRKFCRKNPYIKGNFSLKLGFCAQSRWKKLYQSVLNLKDVLSRIRITKSASEWPHRLHK